MPETPSPRSGNALLRVAIALFAIGLLAILAIFLTPIVSACGPPLWLYLVAMSATPLGLLLALVFALRSGRHVR
ncbi:MAG: hypothetical protein J2P18_15365 [Nocardia sp.]|nr:hypothetical protein [Nocardia sp.]